ncbi:MAG: DegT/DnrJ/EryC1/StrS family aminotransferase [Pseudonocardiales bacterium]
MTTTAPYRVPYRPVGSLLGEAEVDAVRAVLLSGDTLSCGPERAAFEQEFAEHLGVPHAVSLTNCTVGLELATYLARLRPGDEVIAATQTYQATLTPLLGTDVRIRFCDVDPDTLNIAPAAVADLVTPRTRAVFLVHHGGVSADMSAITTLARQSGAVVVEDCAHALGGTHRGRPIGAFGDLACFSFQSYKNISTLGEGGMITTSHDGFGATLRRIIAIEPDADFEPRPDCRLGAHDDPADGLDRHAKNAFTHDCTALRHPGTNSTLAEPAAAVGRVQMRRLDALVARRRHIAQTLDAALGDLGPLRIQRRDPHGESAYHLYTCFVRPDSGIDRDDLARRIDAAGVQIQLRYFPVHLLPEWRARGHRLGECPVAERIWFTEQLNLPIYPQLTDQQLDFMIDTVRRCVRELDR